jgi:CHRD domain
MRRVLSLLFAGALVLLGSAVQAQAQIISCTAALSGGNEVPGIASGAGGNATVTMNVAAGTIDYRVDVFNMPTGTTASHIHAGSPGVAGPVVINFVITPNISNDYVIQGRATVADLAPRPAQGVQSMDDVAQMLATNQAYVNVHSTANPGGEIRGQVSCTVR